MRARLERRAPSELDPCTSGAARGRTAYLRPEASRTASRLPIELPASPCPACPPPVAPRRLAPSQFSLDINVRNEALGGSRAETSAFEGSGLGLGRPCRHPPSPPRSKSAARRAPVPRLGSRGSEGL